MRLRHLAFLALVVAGCSPAASDGSGKDAPAAQAAAPAAATAAPPPDGAPRLVFPVACKVGESCEVQNYVDRDPGPGVKDYMCLSRTYADHGGVDIRLPDLAAQKRGVDVLAAAAGTVLRVRDDMPDVSVRQSGTGAVDGRDCGNGLVIDHGGGWETQYCHMAQGSLRVQPGQTVAAGEPIGRIGLSGMTEYPHLHITVRRAGTVVDPFAPAGGDTCRAQDALWDPGAMAQMAYKRQTVLNTGFTSQAVQMEALEAGALPPAGGDAPALVAYVRAINLEPGDVQELVLRGPAGAVLAAGKAEPMPRARAQHMMFVGKKRPQEGWPQGRYQATYRVVRGDGQEAVRKTFEISL
ncbi:M23 family metallopeptidase [Phenylobacterium terrae]|uniref:M23 family metallopeptidase n=1 Tax=Phenylobacterium terrae TaxID=2665495 RepID=A0ABW4N2F1_9CAUL